MKAASTGPQVAHGLGPLEEIEQRAQSLAPGRFQPAVPLQDQPRIVARGGQKLAMHSQIGETELRPILEHAGAGGN